MGDVPDGGVEYLAVLELADVVYVDRVAVPHREVTGLAGLDKEKVGCVAAPGDYADND